MPDQTPQPWEQVKPVWATKTYPWLSGAPASAEHHRVYKADAVDAARATDAETIRQLQAEVERLTQENKTLQSRLDGWDYTDAPKLRAELAQLRQQGAEPTAADVQLLAWAVVNSHTLARRALARTTSVYDREKWQHVLRICEKAGARSEGILRASLPTQMTEGAEREKEPPQCARS